MDIYSSLFIYEPTKKSAPVSQPLLTESLTVDSKKVKAVFELVKLNGFSGVCRMCEFFEQYSTMKTEGIEKFIGENQLDQTAIDLFNKLDEKGWIEVQKIVTQTKNAMLDNFREGGNRDVEILVFRDSVDTLSIKLKEDGFHLKAGATSSLFCTFQDFFQQCDQEDLVGLKLDHFKGNLHQTNFNDKNVTGIGLNNSDISNSSFTGAVQESMGICGTTLNGVRGFELLRSTKLDNKTEFRGTEIIFSGWKRDLNLGENPKLTLTSNELAEFMNLIDQIENSFVNKTPLREVLMRKLIASLLEADMDASQSKAIIDFFLAKRNYLKDELINAFVMHCVVKDDEPRQQEKYIKGNEERILELMLSEYGDVSEAAARLYVKNVTLFSKIIIGEKHNAILKELEEQDRWEKNKVLNDMLESMIKGNLKDPESSMTLPELPWLLHNNLVHYITGNKVQSEDKTITDDDITAMLRHLKVKLDSDEKKVLGFYETNGYMPGLKVGLRSLTPVSSPTTTPVSTPTKLKPPSRIVIETAGHDSLLKQSLFLTEI